MLLDVQIPVCAFLRPSGLYELFLNKDAAAARHFRAPMHIQCHSHSSYNNSQVFTKANTQSESSYRGSVILSPLVLHWSCKDCVLELQTPSTCNSKFELAALREVLRRKSSTRSCWHKAFSAKCCSAVSTITRSASRCSRSLQCEGHLPTSCHTRISHHQQFWSLHGA